MNIINDFFAIIQSNKVYYIIVTAAIAILMSVAIIIVNNTVSNPKQKKKSVIITLVLTFISEITAATLPVVFPFKGDNTIHDLPHEITTSGSTTNESSTEAPTSQVPSLNQYRYDLYDDNEIIKRIEAINSDLSGEGKYIKPDVLKAFIYAINGDYSLCKSSDVIFDVSNMLINVDNDLVNLMCNSLDSYDNITPINSIADIFCDQYDYEMVLYWQNYYNDVCKKIYENGPTEQTFSEIDEFCVMLFDTFIGLKPVEITENKYLSAYSISDEAKFVIFNCIVWKMSMFIVSQEIGMRDEMIPIEKFSDGSYGYISTEKLSNEILNAANKYFDSLLEKMGFSCE